MLLPSFHHVVLFRLRPGVTLERVRDARDALSRLVETLPGVLHFAVAENLSQDNSGYTLALFSAFEDRQAYEIFTRHAEYRTVWDSLLESVVDSKIVAQGEVS